jgi:hypothetical protein
MSESQLSIIESPHNLYVVFVNECLYVTVQRGAAGTVWLQHVRSRWFVGAERYQPRSAVYDINQTQVGQEHESELEKYKQVECDITIHDGAAVTRCQYKQNAEPERQNH